MEDTRRVLLPLALGAAGAVVSLYALGVFVALRGAAHATPTGGSGHPSRRRTGAPPAGGAAPRSTTSSGVGAPGGGGAVYETAKALDEYLLFHFAEPSLLMPHAFGPVAASQFPARCAALVAKHAPRGGGAALDVGCAVGGATFELARTFETVVGVDFSAAFVAAASKLAAGERLPCTAVEEGHLSTWFVAAAPSGVDCGRVRFEVGDACSLRPSLGPFSAVLASNLLCRLPDPDAFLASLPRLLAPGGVAVLVSPYSWLEEYTPRHKWLGGVVRGGDSVHSAEALKARMAELVLSLVAEEEVPFLIREHARKYQYGVSHGTVWRKTGAADAAGGHTHT